MLTLISCLFNIRTEFVSDKETIVVSITILRSQLRQYINKNLNPIFTYFELITTYKILRSS